MVLYGMEKTVPWLGPAERPDMAKIQSLEFLNLSVYEEKEK